MRYTLYDVTSYVPVTAKLWYILSTSLVIYRDSSRIHFTTTEQWTGVWPAERHWPRYWFNNDICTSFLLPTQARILLLNAFCSWGFKMYPSFPYVTFYIYKTVFSIDVHIHTRRTKPEILNILFSFFFLDLNSISFRDTLTIVRTRLEKLNIIICKVLNTRKQYYLSSFLLPSHLLLLLFLLCHLVFSFYSSSSFLSSSFLSVLPAMSSAPLKSKNLNTIFFAKYNKDDAI